MRRIVFTGSVALSLVALSACSSTNDPASRRVDQQGSAIISGTADTTHPAVMALISDFGNSYTECTGTVFKVDSDGTGWLMTAGHCTVGDSSSPAPTPSNTTVKQGNHYNSGAKSYPVLSITHHPNFNFPDYDFGIVHFSGASAATPIIPLTGPNDGLATGQTIQIYGYGMTVHPPSQDNNDTRNTVAKPISQLETLFVHHDDSNNKGTCEGDSGGPSIVMQNGVEVVVAVTSYGNQNCNGDAAGARLSAVLSWIDSVSGSTSAGAGGGSSVGAGGTGAGATTGAGGGGGGTLDCSTPGGTVGCCNDSTSVTYCNNGTVQTDDCMGMGCGWDPQNNWYSCGGTTPDPSGTYPLLCGGGSSTTQGGGGSPAVGAGGTGAGATGGTGSSLVGAGGSSSTTAGPGAGGNQGVGAGGMTSTTAGPGAGPVGAGPTTGAGGNSQGQGPVGAGPATGAGGTGQAATGTGGAQGTGPTGTGGATTAGGGGHTSATGQGGSLGTTTAGQGGALGNGQGGTPGLGFGAGGMLAQPQSDSGSDDLVGNSGGCQMGSGNTPSSALLLALFALPLLRRRRDSES